MQVSFDWIEIQKFWLDVNRGLLPFAALAYSFIQSWHCAAMCGGVIQSESNRSHSQLLFARLVSYTSVGALMGFFGQALIDSLETELIKFLSIAALFGLTFIFVIPQLLKPFHFFKNNKLFQFQSSTLRGIFIAATPCHSLTFYYGLAALNGSALLGGLMLLSHGVATTPALVKSHQWIKSPILKTSRLRTGLSLLILLQIVYFFLYAFGVFFHGSEEAHQRILFCF